MIRRANYLRPACRWADCFCRTWPPVRQINSTGQLYTWVELAPLRGKRIFLQVYL